MYWFKLSLFRNVVTTCCDFDVNSPFLKPRTVIVLELQVNSKQTLVFGLAQGEPRLGLAIVSSQKTWGTWIYVLPT